MTLGFVVIVVALGQVSSEYTLYHQSASLHQCSMFVLHLSPKLNNFSNSNGVLFSEALPHCYVSLPVVVVVVVAVVVVFVFVLGLFF